MIFVIIVVSHILMWRVCSSPSIFMSNLINLRLKEGLFFLVFVIVGAYLVPRNIVHAKATYSQLLRHSFSALAFMVKGLSHMK